MDGSSSKTIWILNHYASTPQIGGGTRHYDFSKELAKRGYDVTVFASSYLHGEGRYLFSDEYKIEEFTSGFRFVWLRTRPGYKCNGIKRILNMLSYVKNVLRVTKKLRAPDVIIGSSVHPFAWVSAIMLSKRYKAKFVAEVRDLWPQTLIEVGSVSKNHPIVKIFKFIEKWAYRRASCIITLLPYAYEYIKRYCIPESKVVYISNGTDITGFMDLAERSADYVDPNLKKILYEYFCCVYIGSHVISEGLYTIIDAAGIIQAKGYKKIKFVLIGDGTEKPALMARCKKKGIDNIIFWDRVPKHQVPAILALGKINMASLKDIPIYRYGISLNKLFDYLCSSRPTVFAGRVYNDIIKEADAGFSVEPEDPEAFAEAVIDLYNLNEEVRNQLGNNGLHYAQINYDIKILTDKMEKVIQANN